MRTLSMTAPLLVGSLMALPPTSPIEPAALAPVRLGSLEVWTLQDGEVSLPASYLKGLDLAQAKRMLGGRDSAPTPVNAYLVRMRGKIVLVDAGLGRVPDQESGHLGERLAAAGLSPASVDLILITHFHFDHVGGLLKADGSRAFPKAILKVPQSEYAFWFQDPSQLPERLRSRIPQLKAIFEAYEQAGAFQTFEDGATLAPGVRAVAAHGHTGGHTVYAFAAGGPELWCLGDLIHYAAVQFEHPEAGILFDADGGQAVHARQAIFKQAAETGAVLAGAHLPALVRLEAQGAGYRALPLSK